MLKIPFSLLSPNRVRLEDIHASASFLEPNTIFNDLLGNTSAYLLPCTCSKFTLYKLLELYSGIILANCLGREDTSICLISLIL